MVTAEIHRDAAPLHRFYLWENTDPRTFHEGAGFFCVVVSPFFHPGSFVQPNGKIMPLPHIGERVSIAMEWKSLIAGLVFTMGSYAAKCGIGLACGWGAEEKRPFGRLHRQHFNE